MESLFLSSLSSLRTTDECKSINILKNIDNKTPKTKLESVIYENGVLLCEIDHVLSSKQCRKILKNISKQAVFEDMSKKYEVDQRNSGRLLIIDKNVSNMLWQRINKIVGQVIRSNNISIIPFGFDVLNYDWKLNGMNEGIRINCYNKNDQFFGYHKDGQFCNSGNQRSIFSVVIYLNDNFKNGQTNFYFQPNIENNNNTKNNKKYLNDFTIKEEIDYFGGINNFSQKTISPKTGRAVIFHQNVIHEGCPLKSGKNKYILRSDIIVIKKEKEKIGFAISSNESKDYLKALNYFREAQQLELSLTSNDNKNNQLIKKKCNEFYERSLNIRYSFPAKLLKQNKYKIEERLNLSMNIDVIWMIIFDFCNSREIEIISYLYPIRLYPLIKLWQNYDNFNDNENLDKLPSFIPNIYYSFGTYNIFEFTDCDFFYQNEEQCCKVAAIYAFALMSNKYNKGYGRYAPSYIVNYNPYSQKALTIPFNQLLYDVFYGKKCFGAYFKIDSNNDLERKYMSLLYGAQFVGDSYIDNKNFKFKYGQKVERDDKWKKSKWISSGLVKISELNDDGIINHIRTDYSESFKKLNENNNLNNNNYINDLINDMNEYQHPSYCRIFNGNGNSLTLNNNCNCTIHRGEGRYGECKTNIDIYNHLIFDFTQTTLKVNIDNNDNDDNDEDKPNCINCNNLHHPFINLRECLSEYIKTTNNLWFGGWGYKQFGSPKKVGHIDGTDKYYTVNIERLFHSKFDLSFYHACSNMVCVAEKGIDMKFYLNYTHLNHIHLASLKTEDNRVFVWAAYNGVAAL